MTTPRDTNVPAAAATGPPPGDAATAVSPLRPPGRARPARGRASGKVLTIALFVVLLWVHVWFVSAGRVTRWPTYTSYYGMLSDAFARGQAHLLVEPHPRLLALPDPYNPRANAGLRLHDAVLYEGKYYLYWGPVPGMLLVPVKALLAPGPGASVGDQYVVFAFAVLMLAAWSLLLLRARERLFPDAPWWSVGPPLLAIGLGPLLPYATSRAAVYEAAIVGGQAFLALGLYVLLAAFTARAATRDTGRLAAAGLCCGAALGCRPSVLPAVAALAACVGWHLWRTRRTTAGAEPRQADRARTVGAWRDGSWLAGLCAFAAPVAASVAALAAYNLARFGSATEFGVRYQVAGVHTPQLMDRMFAVAYVPANFYRALLAELRLRPEFPHVQQVANYWPGAALGLPNSLAADPMTGAVWWVPFLLFAIVPAVVAVRRVRLRECPTTLRGGTAQAATADGAATERWLVVSLALVAVVGYLPAAAIFSSIPRYVVELAAPGAALAGVGFWQALRTAGPRRGWRRCVIASAVAAVAVTVVLAPLLATIGSEEHFPRHNPDLYRWLGGRTP